jgi:hypothetical protein
VGMVRSLLDVEFVPRLRRSCIDSNRTHDFRRGLNNGVSFDSPALRGHFEDRLYGTRSVVRFEIVCVGTFGKGLVVHTP